MSFLSALREEEASSSLERNPVDMVDVARFVKGLGQLDCSSQQYQLMR